MNKELQDFIDEQLAAGKTIEEIDELLNDTDEQRHADKVDAEDRASLERGY